MSRSRAFGHAITDVKVFIALLLSPHAEYSISDDEAQTQILTEFLDGINIQ